MTHFDPLVLDPEDFHVASQIVGGMQRLSAQRARTLKTLGTPQGPKLCMGLAAYDQRWPGRTARSAFETAWGAAVAEGVRDIRIWSAKWLLTERGDAPAIREFLAGRP